MSVAETEDRAQAPVFARTHVPPGVLGGQVPTGSHPQRSLVYSTAEGYRPLELDLYVPAGATDPVACVVWIHGGGFMFGSRLHPPTEWPAGAVFQSLVDAGIAVASIDYRHAGEAPFPAQLHDAKAAIRYLRAYAAELGIDPARIGVWGESAGGQLAALVGLVHDDAVLEGAEGIVEGSSTVVVVVDFYGTADLVALEPMIERMPPHVRAAIEASGRPFRDPIDVLLDGSPLPDARVSASPVSHVRSDAPPFLIVHGEADVLVPISQSERLVAALRAHDAAVELVRVPGAGHVFGGADPVPQLQRAVEFLGAHLTAD